jgi:hypothetical protein
MQTLTDGRIQVFTFKRGLLSKVAHDLCLGLQRFEVRTDGEHVTGRFFLDSLHVEGAVKNGELDADALSDADKREIVGNIRDSILHTEKHPEAVFEGRAQKIAEGWRVHGVLELVGRREEIDLAVRKDGDRVGGEVELVPSRYGIEPFKALMGAIKLADRVIVRFEFEWAP